MPGLSVSILARIFLGEIGLLELQIPGGITRQQWEQAPGLHRVWSEVLAFVWEQ